MADAEARRGRGAARAPRREYRILGTLEVLANDAPLTIAGRLRRALLSRLLLDANQVVSADRLVDDLWPEEGTGVSGNTLQAQVSRLRADLAPLALDASHPVVETRPPGYLLRTEPGEVDAARFNRLCEEAVAARDNGQWDAARASLDDALALWRGDALVEFADDEWARGAVEALREARLSALEESFDLELLLGRHAAIVPELEQLTRAQPLRERLRGQLMLALYRSGRQADALRAYQQLREHLGEELGIDPDASVRRLENDILLQRPELDWTPPATRVELAPTADAPAVAASMMTLVLPAPLALAAEAATFVGRKLELERCRKRWDEATNGRRQLLLVAAEPGMGKSRVAAEFASEVHGSGGRVLYGRCREDAGVPYQPFVDALTPYVTSRTEEQQAAWRETLPVIARIFPALAPQRDHDVASVTGEIERYVVFEAIITILAECCNEQTTLFVLDDLHWASATSLLLLRQLIQTAPHLPLVMVVTYRDTETRDNPALDDFLPTVVSEPGVSSITLTGLDQDETSDFVAITSGAPTERALAQMLRDETAGNPFFIGEILRHLVETDSLPAHGAVSLSVSDLDIPDGVRAVLGRRIARLSPAARHTLAVAAVAGDGVQATLLRRVPSLSQPGFHLAPALDEAVAARLLVEASPGRYAFAHALVRNVAASEVGNARRAELHGEVAGALEGLPGAADTHVRDLARHYAEAAAAGVPVDIARAVRYAQLAAEDADRQLAYEEAVEHLERALEIADAYGFDDLETRAAMLHELAKLLLWLERDAQCYEVCETLADVARTLHAADHLSGAAIIRTSIGSFRPDPVTEAMCADALEALGSTRPDLRAQVMAGIAEYRCRDLGYGSRAGAEAADALALARETGDPTAVGRCLGARALTLHGTPDAQEMFSVGDEMATYTYGTAGGMWGHGYRLTARLMLGDISGCLADIDAVESFGRARRRGLTLGLVAQYRSTIAHMQGHFDDALRYADELAQWSPTMVHQAARWLLRMHVLRERDEIDEHEPAIREKFAPFRLMAGMHSLLLLIDLAAHRIDAVRVALDEYGANNFARLDGDIVRGSSLAIFAEAVCMLDDRAYARVTYDALAPWSGLIVVMSETTGSFGAADRYLGMLATIIGDHHAAEQHFEAALALENAIGARTFVARTKHWYARLLLARATGDDIARAQEQLSDSNEIAASIGMHAITKANAALAV